ncbi:MAG: hypothetical protein WA003_03935 [Desulfuromonadaceae bacterium]
MTHESIRLPPTPLHLPPQNRIEPRLIPFAIPLKTSASDEFRGQLT